MNLIITSQINLYTHILYIMNVPCKNIKMLCNHLKISLNPFLVHILLGYYIIIVAAMLLFRNDFY